MVDREWVEALVEHERELREAAGAATDRALDLQAREYERRLDLLNHSHTRLDKIMQQTVPRETFDLYCRHTAEWREGVNRQLDEQRGASVRQSWLIGTIVAALAIALRYIP